MQLCHPRDLDPHNEIKCGACGSRIHVTNPIPYGVSEWESSTEHVHLRDALELLGIPVSPRKRRLLAIAVAQCGRNWTDDPLFDAAVACAEREVEDGRRTAEGDRLWQEWLHRFGDRDVAPEDWDVIAEACLAPEPPDHPGPFWGDGYRLLCDIYHDFMPNPFVPLEWSPEWFTSTVRALAAHIYAERAFDLMPILGDALMDAGCDHALVQDHCRSTKPHARGCWVVDAILGKT